MKRMHERINRVRPWIDINMVYLLEHFGKGSVLIVRTLSRLVFYLLEHPVLIIRPGIYARRKTPIRAKCTPERGSVITRGDSRKTLHGLHNKCYQSHIISYYKQMIYDVRKFDKINPVDLRESTGFSRPFINQNGMPGVITSTINEENGTNET